VAAIEREGAAAVGADLAEAWRLEAARPAWGKDLSTETIPLEAGLLDRAISTTKGCYVGQEVIIRILHRGGGRVAKRLMLVECDASLADVPAPGTALHAGDEVVGHVTSAAYSPGRGRILAFAYVRRDAAEPGRRFTLDAGTGVEATAFSA
jgi:tRNA-modifying protein YgfZ